MNIATTNNKDAVALIVGNPNKDLPNDPFTQ